MSQKFASGQNALAECDVCGFQYRLRQLKPLVIKAVVEDVLREAEGEIVVSKEARKAIGRHAVVLFKKRIMNKLEALR